MCSTHTHYKSIRINPIYRDIRCIYIYIQYLIGEHDSSAFFRAQQNTLFTLKRRQFGIDFLDVIHEHELRL